MIEVPLSQGRVCFIDGADLDLISGHRWHWKDEGLHGYAATCIWENGRVKSIRMHRIIMRAQPGHVVDHINRNSLDNRRENLRFATYSLNNLNVGVRANSTTGHTGISFSEDRGKWRARIGYKYNRSHLGWFDTLGEAVAARELAERTYMQLAMEDVA